MDDRTSNIGAAFWLVDKSITNVCKWMMVALLWVMLGSIILGVFFRYFLNDAIIWSEELARFSMIWVAFLGGALTFRFGGHVAIDYFRDLLPVSLHRLITLAIAAFVAAFLLLLIWSGGIMVGRVSEQTSAALEISMSIPYSALPAGGVLMLYQLIVALVEEQANWHSRIRSADDTSEET